MNLGSVQISVLHVLATRDRGWVDHPYGPGWVWDSVGGTRRTLEALVKRGLVDKGEYVSPDTGHKCPQYKISQAGKVFLLGRPYGK